MGVSACASHPNMKGGITNMAKKAKGGKKKAGKKR